MKGSRFKIKLTKMDDARFISHLDFMRLLERAVRRAGLPIRYSQGYNPRPKISLAAALQLGATSEGEYAELWLADEIDANKLVASLSKQLPVGVSLLGARAMGHEEPALATRVALSGYVTGVRASSNSTDFWENVASWIACTDNLEIARERKGIAKTVNIRPMVWEVRNLGVRGDVISVWMMLKSGSQLGTRPDELIAAIRRHSKAPGEVVSVHRVDIFTLRDGKPLSLWES